MKVEIDQSGKIEQTNKDTVLCLSNDTWDAVTITRKTKRHLQEVFRRKGQIRNYVLFVFAAGLTLLIKRNLKYKNIIIDREYYGKEAIINKLILTMLNEIRKVPILHFEFIGKRSLAHHYAHDITTKELKSPHIISLKELFLTLKKTEVGNRQKNA